jgi:hypothetical protein
MDEIIQFNRETLTNVKNWINRNDWEKPNSIFNYGLPDYIFDLINLPIDNNITEVDMICKYLTQFDKKINYLEIGVSVGKTFYQIIKFANTILKDIEDKSFSCIDIEKINPTLENLLDDMYDTKIIVRSNLDQDNKNSIRKKSHNFISTWNNNINYYESDEFDKNIWKTMKKQFNLIFSDALHDPSALISEYHSIKNNNLLDIDGFIYCFDDLENEKNGPMWNAVNTIFMDIKIQYPLLNVTLEHFVVNGWIGQYEHKHNFGVIKCLPNQ